MSNLSPTYYASLLLRSVCCCFYEDLHVMLLDVLLRDKFLRQDEMQLRLSVPGREVKKGLHFLVQENIVRTERCDDESGDRQVMFYYIDFNWAVKAVMLRVGDMQERINRRERERGEKVLWRVS